MGSNRVSMAFERAMLMAPADTATRLIDWGLATGLRRQRAKPGSCGGLSRTSLSLPRQRLPPSKESDALALLGFKKLLKARGRLGFPDKLDAYRAYYEQRATTGSLLKELKLEAGEVRVWGCVYGKQVCGSCYASHKVRLVKGVRVR